LVDSGTREKFFFKRTSDKGINVESNDNEVRSLGAHRAPPKRNLSLGSFPRNSERSGINNRSLNLTPEKSVVPPPTKHKRKSISKLVKLKRTKKVTELSKKPISPLLTTSSPQEITNKRVSMSVGSFFVHLPDDVKTFNYIPDQLLSTIIDKVRKQEKLLPDSFIVYDSKNNPLDLNKTLSELSSMHCHIRMLDQ